MNNFLSAALNRAKKTAKSAGNLGYNYLGGRQFADANRMSQQIMAQGGGVTDVLKNPEYWKTIAGGTAAASSLLGAGGLAKAGITKIGGRLLTKKPPLVAPRPAAPAPKPYRDPFLDEAANPYGISTSTSSSVYNPAAAREASRAAQEAKNAAVRQQAAAEAQALRESMRIIKPIKKSNIAKGTVTTAGTGAAASTQGPKPKTKLTFIDAAKPKKPKTGGK